MDDFDFDYEDTEYGDLYAAEEADLFYESACEGYEDYEPSPYDGTYSEM